MHPSFKRLLLALLLAGLLLAACGRQNAGTPSLHSDDLNEELASLASLSPRKELNLDSAWRFRKGEVLGAETATFNDSTWARVDLPHTWNNLDGQDGGNNYDRDVAWYRKRFTVSSSYAGRKFFIQFNGSNLTTDVWVNGHYLGQHRGGYARFRFDATNAIKAGTTNVIAVKVNNAHDPDVAPLSGDFTFFGGLYRGVRLLITNKLHIQTLDYGGPGVYLTTTSVTPRSAQLGITVKVWNGHDTAKDVRVRSIVLDAHNNVVKVLNTTQRLEAHSGHDFIQTATFKNPHLWNGVADPYLYTVKVRLKDEIATRDAVSEPLGFRSFSIDADKGFFLNGRYLDLRGVNLHQDRLDKGWAVSNADHDEDFALIREMGATAVRLAHYQHADYVYSLADQSGLVVWTEIPLIDKIGDSEAFYENVERQLLELIKQNYNHPSVVFWGIANEIKQKSGPDPNRLLARLSDLIRREDPGRLSTIAHCCASSADATLYHTNAIGYNKYLGWYGGSYNNFAAWADKLHADYPTRKIAISEYGAGASIHQHADNPSRPLASGDFHPEEYQNQFHEAHWKAMKVRPFLWGKFIWNMFDFASDGRHEGDSAGMNDKGLVTYDRKTKKDAFYWYKANWSHEPVLYITSRRFTNRTNASTAIKIYANTDTVRLRLNGVSLGSKTSSNHMFTWTGVTLAPGVNTVEATGTKNGISYRDTVTWHLSTN